MTDKRDKAVSGLSFREAAHLQSMEGNPLDLDDVAMFEMFDREKFSAAERHAYIDERIRRRIGLPAAE